MLPPLRKLVCYLVIGTFLLTTVFIGCSFHSINLNPEFPSSPEPPNGAKEISREVTLSWFCTDPENDPIVFDVYFGNTYPPPLKITNQVSLEFYPGTLDPLTTYYWYIVANDSQGSYTAGPQWRFVTKENAPPYQPSDPWPSNHARGVPINEDLVWRCGDPENDPLLFDIYLGTDSDPPLVETGHNVNNYDPGNMKKMTTYWWKIIAKDNHNNNTEGSVWDFNTGVYPR